MAPQHLIEKDILNGLSPLSFVPKFLKKFAVFELLRLRAKEWPDQASPAPRRATMSERAIAAMGVKIDTATPVTPVDDVIPTDQQRREGATLSNGRRGN